MQSIPRLHGNLWKTSLFPGLDHWCILPVTEARAALHVGRLCTDVCSCSSSGLCGCCGFDSKYAWFGSSPLSMFQTKIVLSGMGISSDVFCIWNISSWVNGDEIPDSWFSTIQNLHVQGLPARPAPAAAATLAPQGQMGWVQGNARGERQGQKCLWVSFLCNQLFPPPPPQKKEKKSRGVESSFRSARRLC